MPKKKSSVGGKGGKKKLSKAEKEKIQLENDADQLRKTPESFNSFCRRGDRWLVEYHARVTKLLKQIDTENEGIVSFDEFKSVMYDLEAPFSAVELHLMCKLVGKETVQQVSEEEETVIQEIEYQVLKDGFKSLRESLDEYSEEILKPRLELTKRLSQTKHCSTCDLALWDGDNFKKDVQRYFEVTFRMWTFENYKVYPGHFTKVIPSHYIGATIEEIIKEKSHLPVRNMYIFREKPFKEPRVLLEAKKSLEDYDNVGGTIDSPTKVTLYYDFKPKFPKCPILMCDHYFSKGVHRKDPDKIKRSERITMQREKAKVNQFKLKFED